MRIFISTGEVSGDLQGALLIAALQKQAAQMGLPLEVLALGGEKMAAVGATLLGDTTAITAFGILEQLPFILPTLANQKRAIASLKANPPDVVVLIDYIGPNIAIGNFLRRELPQVPIVYYITPQVWAATAPSWSLLARHTVQILDVSNKILAIFPQEARYFQAQGANVTWVGHPLVDRMSRFPHREAARAALGINDDVTCVALFPASRRQELKYLLPVMFQAAQEMQSKLQQVHFWIPLSLDIYREAIEAAIQHYGLRATVISHQQQDVMAAADLAITKCGTVNLELALLNVPQVVLYRLSPFTNWVARNVLKLSVPFASPVNLVVEKHIVPEFIQAEARKENITQAALELLLNPSCREQTLADYQELRRCLGEVGVCDRAVQAIFSLLPTTVITR